MSNKIDSVLDEIEELRDRLHDMGVDLKHSKEMIVRYRQQAAISSERIEDLKQQVEDNEKEITNLSSTIEKMEEDEEERKELVAKLTDEIQQLTTKLNGKDEKYFKMLSMWETVRQNNMRYFNTQDGSNFLKWTADEFKNLSKRRR